MSNSEAKATANPIGPSVEYRRWVSLLQTDRTAAKTDFIPERAGSRLNARVRFGLLASWGLPIGGLGREGG